MLVAGALSVTLYQSRCRHADYPGMGMEWRLWPGLRLHGECRSDHRIVVAFRSNGDFRRAQQEQMDKQLSSIPIPRVRK